MTERRWCDVCNKETQHLVVDDFSVCFEHGYIMPCSNCGEYLEPNWNYCPFCGRRRDDD